MHAQLVPARLHLLLLAGNKSKGASIGSTTCSNGTTGGQRYLGWKEAIGRVQQFIPRRDNHDVVCIGPWRHRVRATAAALLLYTGPGVA